MVEPLIVVGLGVAVFVGFNIGGSSTGVAFGPAVGSRVVRKVTAGALFTLFAFVGAWTVGRNVIETMSSGIVDAAVFTPTASVGVLFFTGLSLLVSNVYGVPASTSMTAVGAIVGLGLATGTLNAALMFAILSAWVVAPLLAFAVGAVVGRYLYPYLDAKFSFSRLEDPLVGIDTGGRLPRPRLNTSAAPRDLVGSVLVVAIACYMGFSAGASNAANAVAPLVGNGSVEASPAILLAVAAISLGGFTIARRTLATVGDDITDLPILAALVVSTVGATLITVLSYLGIPASLAVSTTCCIIGLGWGRASRARTLAEMATPAAVAAGTGAGGAGGARGRTRGRHSPREPRVQHGCALDDTEHRLRDGGCRPDGRRARRRRGPGGRQRGRGRAHRRGAAGGAVCREPVRPRGDCPDREPLGDHAVAVSHRGVPAVLGCPVRAVTRRGSLLEDSLQRPDRIHGRAVEGVRVETPGEELEGVDQPRSRPVHVVVPVDDVDPVLRDGGQVGPAVLLGKHRQVPDSLVDLEPTGGGDEHLRVVRGEVGPLTGPRARTRFGHPVRAAGAVDHPRHPVARDHDRVDPVEHRGPGAGKPLGPLLYVVDPGFEVGDEFGGTRLTAHGGADPLDVVEHVREAVGVGRQHPTVEPEVVDGRSDPDLVDGTDVTDPLGDDQVGVELRERLAVDLVDPTGLLGVLDLVVDLGARGVGVDP